VGTGGTVLVTGGGISSEEPKKPEPGSSASDKRASVFSFPKQANTSGDQLIAGHRLHATRTAS
jgi:hypothetical protein